MMIVEINLSKHDRDRSTYHSDENQSNQSNFRFVVKTQHVLNRVWGIRFVISVDPCFKQGLLYDFAVESFWRVSDLFLNFWIFWMYLRYHNKRKNKLELIAIVKFCLSSSYPPEAFNRTSCNCDFLIQINVTICTRLESLALLRMTDEIPDRLLWQFQC